MSRKFIATVLAAALAVTTFTTVQARADSDDTARLLGTAAAVLLLGTALANADNSTVRVHDRTYQKPQNHTLPWIVDPRYGNNKSQRRQVLPAECRAEIRGSRVDSVMTKSCMKRRGIETGKLPDRCEMRVMSRDGRETAWSTRCLRDAGFQISGSDHYWRR